MSQVLPGAREDEDGATLSAMLDGLAGQAPVTTIDELWIFPTRRSETSESTVIVASVFVAGDDERRRILTAHHTARRVPGKGPVRQMLAQQTVTEQGSAPADRVHRLVAGVLRRLDEELAALPPRAVRIGGEVERWESLILEISPGISSESAPA